MTDTGWGFSDLVLVLLMTALATVAALSGLGGALRILLVLPLVVVLPGYALVSLLFPARGDPLGGALPFDWTGGGPDGRTGLDGVSRLALSVALTAAVVPLVALVANFSSMGLTLAPVVVILATTTGALVVFAAVRRLGLPADQRFDLTPAPLGRVGWSAPRDPFRRASKWDARIPNLALVVGVLVLLSSVGYAAVAPPQPPGYTEFRVATEDMTGDTETLYRSSFLPDETTPLEVVLTNQEGERTNYTVVAVLQRIDEGGEGIEVRESSVVGRESFAVGDGERVRRSIDVRPSTTGDDLRLMLLLYRGEPPADPGADTAYRTLRLDVTVSGGSGDVVSGGRSEARRS